MATSINVDYSTTIPNNIGLSEDRRVLKALELLPINVHRESKKRSYKPFSM